MRIDVTPLGGQGRSVSSIAGAIVDYLDGSISNPGAALLSTMGVMVGGETRVAAYYSDSKEGAGRWMGAGAAFHGLSGEVAREAFRRVLEGRHPVSGARLITAQGSAQRAHLAVGTAARFDDLGRPLYAVADAARLLGVTKDGVDDMIADGAGGNVDSGDSTALRTVEVDGHAFVPDAEITRHLNLAAMPPTAEQVLADGDADEWLSTAQAARLLAVSQRYVRQLCRSSIGERADDDAGRARLRSSRAEDGSYVIRRGDLAEFAASRQPPLARVGFDVTLSVEKSFGVVMMLADPQRQARFVAAFEAANEVAMGYLDRHAAVARRCGEVVATEGLVTASFLHGTSRALDPHPHRHNVVANAVVDDAGAVRALDARALHLYAPVAEALATAAARWELRDLGLGWWRRDSGVWEIAGVDEAVIEAFSSRHGEIGEIREALAAELGRPVTDGEDHRIWEQTRPGRQAVAVADLLAGWRRRAGEVGFDVGACFRRTGQAIVHERLPAELEGRLVADLAGPVRGVCGGEDRFTRTNVVKAIVDWSVIDGGVDRKVVVPPAEVQRLTDVFLASEQVVALSASLARGAIRRRDGQVVDGGLTQQVYTTVEMLTTQRRCLEGWRAGVDAGAGVATIAAVDASLAGSTVPLTVEQQALVRSWCRSGHGVQGAVGRAGTGKTTAMAAAARAWEASGFRVIGAAVKGEAARQLAADAGIVADTVALLLTKARHGDVVVDASTVLIVDEGSTLGDRELVALIGLCSRAGATLRIVGDPVQHHSVGAGGMWAYVVTHPEAAGGGAVPELTGSHRLRDPGERRRADGVRDGRIGEVLDELHAAGQLTLSDRDAATYGVMLARWYRARQGGEPHPMVHGRNVQRRLLNRIAQGVLVADGVVDPARAVSLRDGRRLCVGDEVIARHGDRHIHPAGDPQGWMRNGTAGTVIAVTPGATRRDDTVTIAADAGELVVPRPVFDRIRGGLDHAYAVTSYAVQGSTRAASTSAITVSTSRAELYVGMTRGRNSNQLYATRTVTSPLADSDRHLPSVDADLIGDLTERIRPGHAAPVIVADPVALAIVDIRRGRNLAGLHADQRAGRHGPYNEAICRAEAVIRETAGVPHGLAAALPPCSDVPHLHARYRRLAGDIAVQQASYNRPRRAPTSPLETALGPRPVDPVAGADWDGLAERAVRIAVDSAAATVARHRPDLRSAIDQPWASSFLAGLARQGHLAHFDPQQLVAKLDSIAAFRHEHHVDPAEQATLGPRPATGMAQVRYDRLRDDVHRDVAAGQSIVRADIEAGIA